MLEGSPGGTWLLRRDEDTEFESEYLLRDTIGPDNGSSLSELEIPEMDDALDDPEKGGAADADTRLL